MNNSQEIIDPLKEKHITIPVDARVVKTVRSLKQNNLRKSVSEENNIHSTDGVSNSNSSSSNSNSNTKRIKSIQLDNKIVKNPNEAKETSNSTKVLVNLETNSIFENKNIEEIPIKDINNKDKSDICKYIFIIY
jgi:hypothetical protein